MKNNDRKRDKKLRGMGDVLGLYGKAGGSEE